MQQNVQKNAQNQAYGKRYYGKKNIRQSYRQNTFSSFFFDEPFEQNGFGSVGEEDN